MKIPNNILLSTIIDPHHKNASKNLSIKDKSLEATRALKILILKLSQCIGNNNDALIVHIEIHLRGKCLLKKLHILNWVQEQINQILINPLKMIKK